MEVNVKPVNGYCKVFLFGKKGHLVGPDGVIELRAGQGSWIIEGQLFQSSVSREDRGFLLSVVTTDGREAVLGRTKPLRGGQGKFYLKARAPWSMEKCWVLKVSNNSNIVSGKNSPLLLAGLLNCPEDKKSKPGDYLWQSATEEFPQLLEKMMQKVEAITEKVGALEKRRAELNTQSPSAIRQVEPFRPPLNNYKWWKVGL